MSSNKKRDTERLRTTRL